MKKNYLFIVISMLLLITACGKANSEPQYDELYDELITNYISLDSLSILTNLEKTNLIKMRYGLSHNEKVTSQMRKILHAIEDNDKKKLDALHEEVNNLPLSYDINMQDEEIKAIDKEINAMNNLIDHKNKNNGYLSQESYDADHAQLRGLQISKEKAIKRKNDHNLSVQNKIINKFCQAAPLSVAHCIDAELEEYIDDKYSLLSVIPNTWNFYTKSEEKFIEDFLSDLNWQELRNKCNDYYVLRLNDFKNTIIDEQKVIFNNILEIPDFKTIPNDDDFEIDKELQNLVIERTKSQIKEISSDILWDIIIVLLISGIIAFFMDKAIESAKKEAIDRFFKRLSWKKGDGLFNNLKRVGLNALGSYGEYEEEVEAIKSKYNRYKGIANTLVFIVGLVFSWYFVIKPQLRIENELNEEISAELMNSSNTLRINPKRVLNLYLNSNDEDVINTEESIVETIQVVEETENMEVVPEDESSHIKEIAATDLHQINFSGKIGKYPIILELVINGSDVTGKYAYQSTLKKYGDGPGSYFYLSGKIDESGNMNLVSKINKSNDIFEYITLPSTVLNSSSVISGELKNANTGHIFPIELEIE